MKKDILNKYDGMYAKVKLRDLVVAILAIDDAFEHMELEKEVYKINGKNSKVRLCDAKIEMYLTARNSIDTTLYAEAGTRRLLGMRKRNKKI